MLYIIYEDIYKDRMCEVSHLSSVLPIIIDEVLYEGCNVRVERLVLPLDDLSSPSAHLSLCPALAVFGIYPDKESVRTKIQVFPIVYRKQLH